MVRFITVVHLHFPLRNGDRWKLACLFTGLQNYHDHSRGMKEGWGLQEEQIQDIAN